VRAGLRHALATDERVFLMGEDVGGYGGAFAVSLGLLEEFGPERVRNTPLSESAFVGAGIGAALNGMRPIVEVMTVNFSLLSLDQVVNNAATLRYMSGGHRRRPPAGGPARPQPGVLVRARARDQGARSGDGRGRA
jgi:pyruvate dehydrogenase E1 component beta subunit